MPGDLEPLNHLTPIAAPDGSPTPYFIRWAQQRQMDIQAGVGSEVEITAGDGLEGGGDLSKTRTLSLAASGAAPGQYGSAARAVVITVDEFGRLTEVTDVAIAGGGGGGGGGVYAPLVNGDLPGPVLMANADGACIMVEIT